MTFQTNFKPRPKLLDKRETKAATAQIDREENAKVKQRSGGRCEIVEVAANAIGRKLEIRCPRRASHVHHLISGIGRRNQGRSILAAHKLHVCDLGHEEIHGHVLQVFDGTQKEDASTVRYERIR